MSASTGGSGSAMAPTWARSARELYLVAMALFVVTIVIGILNGADAVEFDRNQLLTHVHSGTIGWVTLGIVASAFLVFRTADRRLSAALAVLVPLYVLAFYTGSLQLRALGGVALLVAIAWLVIWTWRAYLVGPRTLPALSIALGLTTFAYGAVVGTLLQLQGALAISILSGDVVGAHAGAMTFGYLVLSAMGLIEWRLRRTTDLPRPGIVQVVALFAGGLILSVGLLTGAGQAAGGLYLLAELVAVALFVIRVGPSVLRAAWMQVSSTRQAAVSSVWVVVALLLFMYIVALFVSSGDPESIPFGVLIASDHAVYIGVITNLFLGLFLLVAADRRVGAPWLDQLTVLAINGGLIVFGIGLVAESAELKRIGAPVMGVALLVALGLAAYRMLTSTLRGSDAAVDAAD